MRAQVKRWGNSAAVRIPAAVMRDAGLRENQAVDMRAQGGALVIEPVADAGLDALLAGVTADNLHGETDFGDAVGGEVW